MGDSVEVTPAGFRTYRWSDPSLVAVALLALASGFGQFGAVAALGDVSKTFGHLEHGATFADQAGLSGSVIGIGLAIIRASSLLGLPLASLADRFGRKPVLATMCATGLALTALTTLSPTYWWFVAIFALGRPFLSAGVGLTQVSAVELTTSHERAKAVSLMAAGYAVGAGLAAIVHSLAEKTLGFRGIFALAVVPLVFLPVVFRRVVEPDRFARVEASATGAEPVLGAVAQPYRRRLLVVALLAFSISVITGPANSLVFIYAENFLHLGGFLTSGMVVAAGAAGLGGLLVGRWLSDRLGRRPTVAVAMAGMAIFAPSRTAGLRGRSSRATSLAWRAAPCSRRQAGRLPTSCSRRRCVRRSPGGTSQLASRGRSWDCLRSAWSPTSGARRTTWRSRRSSSSSR